MKKSTKFISATATLMLASMGASVAQPGYYVGVHGGRNNLDDWDATVSLGPSVRLPGRLAVDSGTHWGVLGGRQTENARYELEYQRGDFDIGSAHLGAVTQATSASGNYQALTANAYRTHDLSDRFGVFAGLGLGWGKVKLPGITLASGCNCFSESNKSGAVVQARVGAQWQIQSSHDVSLQYTWLRLPRASSGTVPGAEYSRKTVGALTVGYRHEFR